LEIITWPYISIFPCGGVPKFGRRIFPRDLLGEGQTFKNLGLAPLGGRLKV